MRNSYPNSKDMLLNPVFEEGDEDNFTKEPIQDPLELINTYKNLKTRENNC